MKKSSKKSSKPIKKSAGRPKLPDNLRRDKYLSTRFSEDEIAKIIQRGGDNYSAWVRSRLLD